MKTTLTDITNTPTKDRSKPKLPEYLEKFKKK